MKIREALEQLALALQEENLAPKRIDLVYEGGTWGGFKIRDLMIGGHIAMAHEWVRPPDPSKNDVPLIHIQLCAGTVATIRRQGEP